ncbi:MAG: hypothetical protein ACRDUY_01755 [Nitriliruptorales bacterium]
MHRGPFRRRPDLPRELEAAWQAFVDCVDVIEAGRRRVLATLPAGRVEPAPVGVGLDVLERAIGDARSWMPPWRVDAVAGEWQACMTALEEAAAAIPEAREQASNPGELEDLLGVLQEVLDPLHVFADAERAWRRRWRVPSRR